MAASSAKKSHGVVDGEAEDLRDISVAVIHFEGLRVEAGTVTGGARRVDAGEKEQLDADEAFAGAGGAAAFGDVEGEAAGIVAARAGGGGGREEAANMIEEAGVGGHVGARGAPDGFLIDLNEAADRFDAAGDGAGEGDGGVRGEGIFFGFVVREFLAEVLCGELDEDLADERGLAGAGDAGDGGENTEGEKGVEVVQVIAGDAGEAEPSRRSAWGVQRGLAGADVVASLRRGNVVKARGRTAVEDLAAAFAGAGANIDDPVGAADDVDFVLDDEKGVAGAFERVERVEEGFSVGGMKAGGGLIEDIDDAEEIGMHLRGEAEALQLAGGEGGRAALESR